MPTAMSLTRGRLQIAACNSAQHGAGDTRGEHAEPWRAGQATTRRTAHRAHQQRAFEPEVHATALFRQHFAQAHEQIRRRHAKGAADDARAQTPHQPRPLASVMSRPPQRTAAGRRRFACQHAEEDQPLQHQRRRVRHARSVAAAIRRSPKCRRREARPESPPADSGARGMRRGCLCNRSRRSAIRSRAPCTASTSIAPARPAAPPPITQATIKRRPIGSPATCAARAIAAENVHREAERRVVAATMNSTTQSDDADDEPPVHGPCRESYPMMNAGGTGQLVAFSVCEKSRIGPADQMIEERDRDVIEQQARDRLVDAAARASAHRRRRSTPRRRTHHRQCDDGSQSRGRAATAVRQVPRRARRARARLRPPMTSRPTRAGTAVQSAVRMIGAAWVSVPSIENRVAESSEVERPVDLDRIVAAERHENAEQDMRQRWRRSEGTPTRSPLHSREHDEQPLADAGRSGRGRQIRRSTALSEGDSMPERSPRLHFNPVSPIAPSTSHLTLTL